jgi:hypothetical protein
VEAGPVGDVGVVVAVDPAPGAGVEAGVDHGLAEGAGAGGQAGGPVDDVEDELVAVQVVEHDHVEGSGGGAFFFVAADVDVVVVGAAVGETGESMPVPNSASGPAGPQGLDQPGCAFMGTIVHQGSAQGVVACTGAGTTFGKIAAGLAERPAQTAFEVGLSRFSRFLFAEAAVLTAFIFVINVALSRPLIDALLFLLAIAVGIAPEMMPAIVTVSLSAGSKALAAKKDLAARGVGLPLAEAEELVRRGKRTLQPVLADERFNDFSL